MTVEISVSVTGPQVIEQLVLDDEEFAHALMRLASEHEDVNNIAADVIGYIHDVDEVTDWLHGLADALSTHDDP